MSEKNELQNAIGLVLQGKRSAAKAALLVLEPRIRDPHLRVQLIDAMLSVLDPIRDNAKQIALSVEGTNIAETLGLPDLQAHFMARRADFLMWHVSLRRHRMAMLKLAPNWIAFATKAEKTEYESLVLEVNNLEKEIDGLLSHAISQAEKSGNKRDLGFILMSKAAIESSRYLQFKTAYMAHGIRAKIWMKFRFIRYPFFEYLLTAWNGDARKAGVLFSTFRSSLLRAAHLFEEIGDANAGAAYYNLANDFRTAYQFRLAKKYLAKAKVIATKHDDKVVLGQVEEMYEAIRDRNKHIPDYLNGETREWGSG